MRVSGIIGIGILAALGLVACSGGGEPASGSGATAQASGTAKSAASSQASGAAAPGSTADTIAVGHLEITIDGKALELKDDGTFTIAGKPMGTFSKNEIKLADGTHVVTVGKDGAITINAEMDLNKIGAKFNEKGGITTAEKGDVLRIEDDGKVMVTGKDNLPTFTGFKPELRRAASLMMMLFMMESDLKRLPAASAAPAAPAPPK